MNLPKLKYCYPAGMGGILLLALEEIIGGYGINAVLNTGSLKPYIQKYPASSRDLDFSFDALASIQAALEAVYGVRSGRGIALRTGRTFFKYFLDRYAQDLVLSDPSFRLLPMPKRMKGVCETLADFFNQNTDQRVHCSDDQDSIRWTIECCPLCWKRETLDPVCFLAVGLLQEATHWVSGGKIFTVQEIQCIACGDPACTITIGKVPLRL